MKIAIHQPNYLPHSTFFKKMALCDTFIILDDVQYEARGWTNRNRLRTTQEGGWSYLTVPVEKHDEKALIKDIRVAAPRLAMIYQMNVIELWYKRAKNFEKVWPILRPHFNSCFDNLIDLNVNLILEFCRFLKINPNIIMASEYGIKTKGSQRVLDLVLAAHGDTYISGPGALNYLKKEDFDHRAIPIVVVNGDHKPYKQIYEPFIEGLSELDFLMNEAKLD